eukprot:jgi/Chrpa1/22685/Chrysochromulina_OHIO_Genome00025345-RA
MTPTVLNGPTTGTPAGAMAVYTAPPSTETAYETDLGARGTHRPARHHAGGCAPFTPAPLPKSGASSTASTALRIANRNEDTFNHETAVTVVGKPGATATGGNDEEYFEFTQDEEPEFTQGPPSPEAEDDGTQQYPQWQQQQQQQQQQHQQQQQQHQQQQQQHHQQQQRQQQQQQQQQQQTDTDVAPPVATALAFIRAHVPPDSMALSLFFGVFTSRIGKVKAESLQVAQSLGRCCEGEGCRCGKGGDCVPEGHAEEARSGR